MCACVGVCGWVGVGVVWHSDELAVGWLASWRRSDAMRCVDGAGDESNTESRAQSTGQVSRSGARALLIQDQVAFFDLLFKTKCLMILQLVCVRDREIEHLLRSLGEWPRSRVYQHERIISSLNPT